MSEQAISLLLTRDDYELLKKYISSRIDSISAEQAVAAQLQAEIQNAQIVENEDEIPSDLIRLNSHVVVKEERTGRQLRFQLVLPGEANIKKEKLSVFAPLGIALMGYRKGQEIKWKMPSGEKTFLVEDVF